MGKALEFSAADLLENRDGRLGLQQFARLARGRVISSLMGVFISLITPILIRIGWLFAVEERSLWRFLVGIFSDPSTILRQSSGPIEEPIPYLFWVVLAVFPLITLHYVLRVPWGLFADLVNRKVKCETGMTTHRWDERRTRNRKGREGDLISSYAYLVNGKKYRVNRAAFEALAPLLEYNLYYMPISRIVVGMEPLEAAHKAFDPASKGFDLLSEKRPVR